jgi:hypothetical protein
LTLPIPQNLPKTRPQRIQIHILLGHPNRVVSVISTPAFRSPHISPVGRPVACPPKTAHIYKVPKARHHDHKSFPVIPDAAHYPAKHGSPDGDLTRENQNLCCSSPDEGVSVSGSLPNIPVPTSHLPRQSQTTHSSKVVPGSQTPDTYVFAITTPIAQVVVTGKQERNSDRDLVLHHLNGQGHRPRTQPSIG